MTDDWAQALMVMDSRRSNETNCKLFRYHSDYDDYDVHSDYDAYDVHSDYNERRAPRQRRQRKSD